MTHPSATYEAHVAAMSARYRDRIVAAMRAAIEAADAGYAPYIRYHLGWEDAQGRPLTGDGGKMLRPLLCVLACEAVGADADDALPAAVAIELLHNFSLIHDDIEDGSETRHGRPTLWTLVGREQAINTGDGLFAIAQRSLLDLSVRQPAATTIRAAIAFNDACIRLCEGQRLDLEFERRALVTVADYEVMITGKTGALLGAATALGALCGGASDDIILRFERFGSALGLGFQIQDDVLGIWGNPIHTGKSAADDIRQRKKSFPVAWAMELLDEPRRKELRDLYGDPAADSGRIVDLIEASGARDAAIERARLHASDALAAVSGLDLVQDRFEELQALTAFVVARSR